MSSRTPEELDQLFKHVPNLGLIAENGCFIKDFGSSDWNEMTDPIQMQSWKDSIEDILTYYHERTPGSWIEARHCSLIFHYKNAEDMESASRQAGDCASHINDACEEQRVRAIPVEGGIVVEPIDWSKGTAADKIFGDIRRQVEAGNMEKPDFLMVAGDGRDDEIIFRWANALGKSGEVRNVTTVSLGSRNTEAKCTLTQGVTGKSLFFFSLLLSVLFNHKMCHTNHRNRCPHSSSEACTPLRGPITLLRNTRRYLPQDKHKTQKQNKVKRMRVR